MFNIKNIIIGFGNTINNFFRANFDVSQVWVDRILNKYYDNEIKAKYISELHQDTRFEELHLLDILDFGDFLIKYCDILNNVASEIIYFKVSYEKLNEYLESEKINYKEITIENDLKFKNYPNILFDKINMILYHRESISSFFNNRNNLNLEQIQEIQEFDIYGLSEINYFVNDWDRFLDKEPDHHVFYQNFRLFSTVLRLLEDFNTKLKDFKNNFNHKIISGSAGTGKSHYLAYLVDKVIQNNDLAVFLKPKSFSGDNINFDEKLLELLEVPKGYTLHEVLEKINDFAKTNDKRCFIFIDALNETTKSNIGFSDIWKINLQNFINQIKNYPYLYFVCSLRTSYIEMIWDSNPYPIVEIKGFENRKITKNACERYFAYYKIIPSNIQTADISIFRTPLLLDLFCKLKNPQKEKEVELTIDIESYLKIFQDYLNQLINEVKRKLNFVATTSIEEGFYKNSTLFYDLNQDFLTTNQFVSTFDLDPLITNDRSIARSVLEGFLIFIKEIFNDNEYIKHTYQEVGGFLIATKLSNDFPNIADIITSQDFINKIIGTNQNTHHQLRLDILKFLIAIKPEIIPLIKDNDSILLSWDFLINSSNTIYDNNIPKNILESANNEEVLNYILYKSEIQWFNKNSATNFSLISSILKDKNLWDIDLTWSFYIYKDFDFIVEYINYFNTVLKDKDEEDRGELAIAALFASNTLTTNIRELRDKLTVFLIEYGLQYPLELLDLAKRFCYFSDIYVYERLVSCCYGVMMIRQNDKQYIENYLPTIAKELFELQFSENPKAPKYNYIVIDSIKHLLDFAFENGAIDFSEEQYKKLYNYEFTSPYEWQPPSEEQQDSINASHETSWPEPIGMDFGIYTIPRLIRKDKENNQRKAIANVYKRIYELGYEELDLRDSKKEEFKDFVWGHKIYGVDGKVDRLGKKYSWIAFFDYAGYLLLMKKLNVFDKNNLGRNNYQRLSDVDIDISLPNTNYENEIKLFNHNLLEDKLINQAWYNEIKIDLIKPLFKTEINGQDYTMLYGFVEQRIDDDYKVRSFLMIETMFVEKNKDLELLKKESDLFEWENATRVYREHIYKAYFGELYWADTNYEYEREEIDIPTGEVLNIQRKPSFYESIRDREVPKEDIEENVFKKLWFNAESTLLDYLWETNSELLKGFGEYFPSVRMGRFLNLKADPQSGKILDHNLNEAYKCIHFEDETFFKNTFNYMRSDLIKKYLDANNLSIVYQVKQHSYDENYLHNRKLKFFIVE